MNHKPAEQREADRQLFEAGRTLLPELSLQLGVHHIGYLVQVQQDWDEAVESRESIMLLHANIVDAIADGPTHHEVIALKMIMLLRTTVMAQYEETSKTPDGAVTFQEVCWTYEIAAAQLEASLLARRRLALARAAAGRPTWFDFLEMREAWQLARNEWSSGSPAAPDDPQGSSRFKALEAAVQARYSDWLAVSAAWGTFTAPTMQFE